MDFLFSLGVIRRVSFLILLGALGAHAQDYCSLTVHVTTSDGHKPTGVPVTLVESGGHVEIGTTTAGEVRFCGLGLSTVTLTIGERNQCNEVVVHNVAM